MPDLNTIKTPVYQCARCGDDHAELEFVQFARPIEDSDSTIWTYWTMCPTTNEPILLKVTEEDDAT